MFVPHIQYSDLKNQTQGSVLQNFFCPLIIFEYLVYICPCGAFVAKDITCGVSPYPTQVERLTVLHF